MAITRRGRLKREQEEDVAWIGKNPAAVVEAKQKPPGVWIKS